MNDLTKQERLRNTAIAYLSLKDREGNRFIGKELKVNDQPLLWAVVTSIEIKVGIVHGGDKTIISLEEFDNFGIENVVDVNIYFLYKEGQTTIREITRLNPHILPS